MLYLVPAVFGFIAGLVSGFGLSLLTGIFHDKTTLMIGGMVAGCILGAIAGSIGGEMIHSNKPGRDRLFVAAIFGAVGGFLGATKLEVVWMIFRNMNWPTPI